MRNPASLLPDRSVRNTSRAALLVLLLLLSSLTALVPEAAGDGEKGVIHGTVTDRDSGEALDGASISIRGEGGNHSLETDSQGRYRQEVEADSDYTVKANLEGYEEELDHVHVSEGQEKQVDFRLEKVFTGRTWYVDDDAEEGGDGTEDKPLRKIQWALDNASDDDRVFVYAGRYQENLVVNNSLELEGEGRDNTTIDGRKSGTVVELIEDKVTVRGFTITRSGTSSRDAGLRLSSSENLILDTNCSGNRVALDMGMSLNNIVRGNIFTGSSYRGVYLANSDGNLFENNSWVYNGYDELYLSTSHNNLFTGNSLLLEEESAVSLHLSNYNDLLNNSVEGGDSALVLTSSRHNLIQGNRFSNNTGDYSILMGKGTESTILRDNQVLGDRGLIPAAARGLELFQAEEITVTGNVITGFHIGVYSNDSEDVELHFNSLHNNAGKGVLENTGILVNATNNWWGDASGPYHSEKNSDGQGSEVSDNVLFEPWLESEELGRNRSVLSGTVLVKGSDKAVNEATVNITGLDCNCSFTVRTNVNGYYERLLSKGGNYSVSVERKGYNSSQANVSVPTGESVSLNFQLEKKEAQDWTRIYGQVRNFKTGDPLEGAKISILLDGNGESILYTDSQGNYEQDFDQPGNFTVTASMAGYLQQSSSFDLKANQAKRQDFQLEKPPNKGVLDLTFLENGQGTVALPSHIWYRLEGGEEHKLDIEVRARNTGEDRVNYTFFDPHPEDLKPSPNLRPGVEDVLPKGVGGEFYLDPGQELVHAVTVDVSAETITPGNHFHLPLRFRDDDKEEEQNVLVNISILSVYSLELRDLEDIYEKELPLSGVLELELEAKNLGNSFVDLKVRRTIDEKLELTEHSPWNDMVVDLAPVSLDEEARGSLSLKLEVQYRPPSGSYPVQLRVYPAGDPEYLLYANYSITVTEPGAPWVDFIAEKDSFSLDGGDEFELDLTVTNKGDLRDSFSILVEPGNEEMEYWLQEGGKLEGMEPEETVEIGVRVRMPDEFEDGETIRISMSSMSDPGESRDVTITVNRKEDPSGGDGDSPGFQGAGMLLAFGLALLLTKRFSPGKR